jgi:hypothetical protein
VLICGVTLAVLGTAVGATRTTTFTAASTLQVGKVNPNSPGFYGFVQSASQLATMFSRAITAGPVLHRIQARLGVSPRAATSRLSAEPIPNSPAFRVIATGPSADAAIQLANVTAGSVIAYEGRSNAYDSDTARLFRQYRAASLKQAKATTAIKQAQREYGRFPTAEQRAALDRAEARRADASLEAQALAASYQLSAQSTTRGLISLLAGAAGASSDRGSKLQLLGFVGLLGGLLLGCALAQVVERRSRWTRHWLLHPYAARPGR